MGYNGASSFENFYNKVDFLNLFMSWFSIYWTEDFNDYRDTLNIFDSAKYQSYRRLDWYMTRSSYLQTINGFFLWFKVFKFITFSRRMLMLVGMLMSAAKDIIYFMLLAFCP